MNRNLTFDRRRHPGDRFVRLRRRAGTRLLRSAVATPHAAETGGSHAEGIVPGSYADWCAEHGVPETACTRCDASLIAAFKATGDWCEEHGLPKSQCLSCDPTLKITRAPKPEGIE
jgi:hypothetical protein